MSGEVVIVGGTSGPGLAIGQAFAERGDEVAITSRDLACAENAADEIRGKDSRTGVRPCQPGAISGSPKGVGTVKHLVLGAEVLEAIRTRTPTGRLATTEDVVNAIFLLENPSVNGTDLQVDGGWLLL